MKELTPEAEARMMQVIEDISATKLQGMLVAAEISHIFGKTSGEVHSGDYRGYWNVSEGKVQLYAVTRSDETLDDYYSDSL